MKTPTNRQIASSTRFDYLQQLIRDLQESGNEATAFDFLCCALRIAQLEALVKLLSRK